MSKGRSFLKLCGGLALLCGCQETGEREEGSEYEEMVFQQEEEEEAIDMSEHPRLNPAEVALSEEDAIQLQTEEASR